MEATNLLQKTFIMSDQISTQEIRNITIYLFAEAVTSCSCYLNEVDN
jgi:hypothetical protein